MPSPLMLIAPALLNVLGETAQYISDSTGDRASVRVLVNRGSQAQLPGFAHARVLEKDFKLKCRRRDLPTTPHLGDQFVLATGEIAKVKRIDMDNGNIDLMTFSVKLQES